MPAGFELGAEQPLDVLQVAFWNNFFLMVILIWIQTGFAMTVLSAAIKAIPDDIIEALEQGLEIGQRDRGNGDRRDAESDGGGTAC